MTILLLAGTSEARDLAQELHETKVIASLAGETRKPADLGVPMRIGGFGGPSGLRAFCLENQIKALVDATHPFAAQISDQAAKVAKGISLPHLILQRAEWRAGPKDNWVFVDKIAKIDALISEDATVFVGTGRKTLAEFEMLANRRLLVRVIDPPLKPFPFKNGGFVVGRPPFSVDEEVAFFEKENVDWLVVKNSGGVASKSKLDAAAKLGLKVAVINRPKLPKAERVTNVKAAVEWLRKRGLHG